VKSSYFCCTLLLHTPFAIHRALLDTNLLAIPVFWQLRCISIALDNHASGQRSAALNTPPSKLRLCQAVKVTSCQSFTPFFSPACNCEDVKLASTMPRSTGKCNKQSDTNCTQQFVMTCSATDKQPLHSCSQQTVKRGFTAFMICQNVVPVWQYLYKRHDTGNTQRLLLDKKQVTVCTSDSAKGWQRERFGRHVGGWVAVCIC
jgi:hypothetical protein